jgi:histidine triad (HIT) family protein
VLGLLFGLDFSLFASDPRWTTPMSTKPCVFCEIVADKSENTRVIFEDEHVVAFHDIKPAAQLHLLVIPRAHVSDTTDLKASDAQLVQVSHAAQFCAR